MTVLESRLSKLEAAAGVGLDPMDRFERECNARCIEELLSALRWLRARISNTELLETPVEVIKWLERVVVGVAIFDIWICLKSLGSFTDGS